MASITGGFLGKKRLFLDFFKFLNLEFTFAEEKSWHIDHFRCFGCDKHLGGHRYITKDEKPFCIDCYMDKFARVIF